MHNQRPSFPVENGNARSLGALRHLRMLCLAQVIDGPACQPPYLLQHETSKVLSSPYTFKRARTDTQRHEPASLHARTLSLTGMYPRMLSHIHSSLHSQVEAVETNNGNRSLSRYCRMPSLLSSNTQNAGQFGMETLQHTSGLFASLLLGLNDILCPLGFP